MNNKILIIYPYINQEPMVYNLIVSLRKLGVNIDAVCSFNLKFAVEPLQKISLFHRFIYILSKLPLPKWKGLLFTAVSRRKAILKISNNYDIIDFHSFIVDYDNLIKELSARKTIKVTFWGSDFYRASAERRKSQKETLKFVDSIQISTASMKNDIMNFFGEFENKVRVANFGIQQFDLISKLKASEYSPQYKIGQFREKLMVVCGYNGSEAQQHKIIIDAFDKLDKEVKKQIFLVFPMTYGSESTYEKLIETELAKIDISYLILNKHLSEIDIAKLRIETDIVVNIQKTDAFSGSLQQHLYCENLVLVGDWLPYDVLNEYQVFFKSCAIHKLRINIEECITNFAMLSNLICGNREKMYKISSLQVTAQRIASIYKEFQV